MEPKGTRADYKRGCAAFKQLTCCASPTMPRLSSEQTHSGDFVVSCESVSLASQIEKCHTHRTVGLAVLALNGIPVVVLITSALPRLI
jgi:hypothetical protein